MKYLKLVGKLITGLLTLVVVFPIMLIALIGDVYKLVVTVPVLLVLDSLVALTTDREASSYTEILESLK
jgi:hypothetical protein